MATINVRTDDQTRAELEALARGRGITVSEVLRTAIDHALGRDVEPPGASGAPTSLTLLQRRTLALQHEILARLDPDEAGYHQRAVRVLEHGFVTEYDDEFYTFAPELSRAETGFVMDVLDMFSVLKRSMAVLGADKVQQIGQHAEHALSYRGFDFNNTYEGRLAAYAQFLIDTDRWTDLAEHFDSKHEHGNSHMPMLATYQRMLAVFKPIWQDRLHNNSRGHGEDRYRLDEAELKKVYEAWPYPRD